MWQKLEQRAAKKLKRQGGLYGGGRPCDGPLICDDLTWTEQLYFWLNFYIDLTEEDLRNGCPDIVCKRSKLGCTHPRTYKMRECVNQWAHDLHDVSNFLVDCSSGESDSDLLVWLCNEHTHQEMVLELKEILQQGEYWQRPSDVSLAYWNFRGGYDSVRNPYL